MLVNKIKKSKKGFTLTEMIVVLVIIVILIALLVPTLVGYIDKAKEKSAIAEGKLVLTAAQTITSESYGFSESLSNGVYSLKKTSTVAGDTTAAEVKAALEMSKLAEMTSKGAALVKITDNKVAEINYINGSGQGAYYTPDGGWTAGKEGTIIKGTDTLKSLKELKDCTYSK